LGLVLWPFFVFALLSDLLLKYDLCSQKGLYIPLRILLGADVAAGVLLLVLAPMLPPLLPRDKR
jgi:hypothetical protein